MEFRKSLLDWGDGSNKPRTHIKKPEVQGHVYNPGVEWRRQADPWASLASSPGLFAELRAS